MRNKSYQHLAYLGYRQFRPSLPLRPFVQCYWIIQQDNPLRPQQEEYLHPDGALGIMFNLGDELRLRGETMRPSYFLDGPNTSTNKLTLHGRVHTIGIRFHPGGAHPFLKLPLHELSETTLALDDFGPRSHFEEIYSRLVEAPSTTAKIQLLDQWLYQHLQAAANIRPEIQQSLHLLQQQQGQSTIPDIATTLHISQRQLERLFKRWIGLSPKKYASLLRVAQARRILKSTTAETTADAAYLAGFYDQSHLIREFKAVEGITPMTYRQKSLARQQAAKS